MSEKLLTEFEIVELKELLVSLTGAIATIVGYQESNSVLELRVQRKHGHDRWRVEFGEVSYFCGPMRWEVTGLELVSEDTKVGRRHRGLQWRLRDIEAGFEVVCQGLNFVEK